MAKTPMGAVIGRRVPGSGPTDARLVVLGEAPGKDEELEGLPFVGASGQFQREVMREVGVAVEEVRWENVVEVRPPENKLTTIQPEVMARWRERCEARLGALRPNVIVPVGNVALNMLLGTPLPVTKKGKWRIKQGGIDWPEKITNWRGSVFRWRGPGGVAVKVIPTFHPAKYLWGAGEDWAAYRGDWERIARDVGFGALRLEPKVEVTVAETTAQLWDFMREVDKVWSVEGEKACLAIDIETPGRVVHCVGFSVSPSRAFVIPTQASYWKKRADVVVAWRVVRMLCQHAVGKTGHFFNFDRFMLLAKYGIGVNNVQGDTQYRHLMLDPRDQHKLAYCASRDLRVRFWKNEGKEEETGARRAGGKVRNWKKLCRYCGKDVGYTRALEAKYRERVREAGLEGEYDMQFRQLADACLELSVTGMRVDEGERKKQAGEVEVRLGELAREMTTMAGESLVAKTGLSGVRVGNYFYDRLGCRERRKRGSGGRTVDELTLRRLSLAYKKARPMVALVLEFRQLQKRREFLDARRVDRDGRMRGNYTPTARTQRLRCAANPTGTGANMQNQDRASDVRKIFVPDDGHVLVQLDASQAEDRLVNGMSGDAALLALAHASPVEVDQHVLNASLIFDVEYEELLAAYRRGDPDAKTKRDLGKRVRHAANYGMEGVRMAEIVLLETEGRLVLDPGECDEWLDALHRARPGLAKYHTWVRQQVVELGFLQSAWGMRWWFRGLRIAKENYKEAYADMAQNGIGVLTNVGAWLPFRKEAAKRRWRTRVVQQGHDSLLFSSPPREAWDVVEFVHGRWSRPRVYPGAGGPWKLSMPVGIAVGENWKVLREWKVLPERREFEAVVRALVGTRQWKQKHTAAA